MDNELKEAFKQGVRDVYNGPVLFLDPTEFSPSRFNRNTPPTENDWLILADAYNRRFPNAPQIDPENPDHLTLEVKTMMLTVYKAPVSLRLKPPLTNAEETICIIALPDENYATKESIISRLTGIEEQFLLPVPGETGDYWNLAGLHEGAHCQTAERIIDPVEKLSEETRTDGIAFNKASSAGKTEAVNTMLDARAISATFAPTHATTITLKPENVPEGVTGNHLGAALGLQYDIYTTVAESIGLDNENQAAELYKENPQLFLDVLDNLTKQGAFDKNHLLKDAITDYSAAMRRRVDLEAMGNGHENLDTEAEQQAAKLLGREPGPAP